MESETPVPENQNPAPVKPARKFRWIKRLLVIALGSFVALHVYAALLKFVPVPGTILMVQRHFDGKDVRRDWTKIEDISPYLIFAVIGAEDSRFCEHSGIDWQAVKEVKEERETTSRRRGGSSITQQTAKNVFLWNGGGWLRKLPEAWMTLVIDKVWGKKRVMEVYLNVAEWGDGIFGAEAAAQARFGKPARDLTAREAALLAAVLPSPHKWRVNSPGNYVSIRANTLVGRAADVAWGGYGDCVKIENKGKYFLKPVKQDPAALDQIDDEPDESIEPDEPVEPVEPIEIELASESEEEASVEDGTESVPEPEDVSPQNNE